MNKHHAIRLLGGAAKAARRIGISPSAISLWPEELSPAIVDRVQAAIARAHLPPDLLGMEAEAGTPPDATPTDASAEQGA